MPPELHKLCHAKQSRKDGAQRPPPASWSIGRDNAGTSRIRSGDVKIFYRKLCAAGRAPALIGGSSSVAAAVALGIARAMS
jgi:hypothetical protein